MTAGDIRGKPVDGRGAIPRLLHFTWRTRDIPRRYRAFVDSWVRHHPDWRPRLWTDDDLRRFVDRHDPAFLPVFDGYPDPIERVDAARYLVMAHLGGVFVDLDLECFRAVDPLLAGERLVIGLEPLSHGRVGKAALRGITEIVCPTFLASAPGHRFWDDVRAALVAARDEPDPLDATGPFLLSRVRQRYQGPDPVRILDPDILYPVDRDDAWAGRLFDLEEWNTVAERAHAHHHWDGTWFRDTDEAHIGAPVRAAAIISRPGEPRQASTLTFVRQSASDVKDGFVSCLMVTRGRAAMAAVAIRCFQAQTWPERELVIVDDDPDPTLAETVRGMADPRIRHIPVPSDGRTLGELRNLAVDAARGPFVCQWDDDDLYDPLRIEYQLRALRMTGSEVCFLLRWVQWMPRQRAVSISTRRTWEGSLLGRKTAIGRYPALRRGEDTPVTNAISASLPTVHLDLPRLYVYVGHQRNTHGTAHHHHLLKVATARFLGDRADAVLHELARRLPIAAAGRAARAVAAAPPPPVPPPVRPLDAVAAEARAAMAERRHADALAGWEEVLRHRQDQEAAIAQAECLFRLRRFEAAMDAYREASRRYRGSVEAPHGFARVLLAVGRPDAARKALEEALARDPGHANSWIEIAIIDLRARRFPAAEDGFERATALAPDDRRGWMGLAAVAVRRGDWQVAHDRWLGVWQRFGEPSAPQEIATALLLLDRLEDAWRFLDGIPHSAWPAATRLFTGAMLAKLAHDPDRLLAILDAERVTVLADEVLRRMLVEALTLAGRLGEAAAVVVEAGIGRTPTGQMVAMHALVQAGADELVRRHLDTLARPPALHRTSARLLADVAAHIRAKDGPAALRAALVDVARSQGAARELRLAAGFELECAASLDALREGAPLPPGRAARPLTVPANSEDLPEGWDFDPMERGWSGVERVRTRHAATPLDPRSNLTDALTLAERIAGAIADRRPLAVVRLGDGEGNFLPYAPDLAPCQSQDQRAIQRLWWSDRTLDDEGVAHVATALAAAIRDADVVGIPDQQRLAFSLGRAMRPGQTSHGLLAVVDQFAGSAPPPGGLPLAGPDTMITSCHLHSALAWWRLWDVILGRAAGGALVTGRGDLADELRCKFGFAVTRTHRVPPERKYRRGLGHADAEGEQHYPDGLGRVRRELAAAVRPGEVVLVAAGILGKIYCSDIRAAGGIALDVGSAADHWCGHATRTRDEAASYAPPPGLAAAYAARSDLDRLYPALAPSAFFQGRD